MERTAHLCLAQAHLFFRREHSVQPHRVICKRQAEQSRLLAGPAMFLSATRKRSTRCENGKCPYLLSTAFRYWILYFFVNYINHLRGTPVMRTHSFLFFFFFPSFGLSILCFRTIISMQSAVTLFCFYSYCHMRLYISPLSFLASMLPHIFHRVTHFKLHSLLLQSRNGPALRSQEINAPIS